MSIPQKPEVHEAAEELTLRRGEEGGLCTFIDAANVGDTGFGPPLVDEGWHAICPASFEGIDGEEWENMYYKCVELGKADQDLVGGERNKGRTKRNTTIREQVRQATWEKHLQSRVSALEEASRGQRQEENGPSPRPQAEAQVERLFQLSGWANLVEFSLSVR